MQVNNSTRHELLISFGEKHANGVYIFSNINVLKVFLISLKSMTFVRFSLCKGVL